LTTDKKGPGKTAKRLLEPFQASSLPFSGACGVAENFSEKKKVENDLISEKKRLRVEKGSWRGERQQADNYRFSRSLVTKL